MKIKKITCFEIAFNKGEEKKARSFIKKMAYLRFSKANFKGCIFNISQDFGIEEDYESSMQFAKVEYEKEK